MSASSPADINKAHDYATKADELSSMGKWEAAIEQRFKAAEAFLECVECTPDETAKRALRRMQAEQTRAGRDLQRRLEQEKAAAARATTSDKKTAVPGPGAIEDTMTLPTSPALLPGVVAPQPSRSPSNVHRRVSSPVRDRHSLPVTPPPSLQIPGNMNSSSQPPSPQRLYDSQVSYQTIDDSYMVLGGRAEAGDPFNQFWKVLEGMLDNLSQPVAFATAPLTPDKATQNPFTDFTASPPDAANTKRDASNNSKGGGSRRDKSRDLDFDEALESSDADSFYVISSASSRSSSPAAASSSMTYPPLPTSSMRKISARSRSPARSRSRKRAAGETAAEKALKEENQRMRAEVETLKSKLAQAAAMMKARINQEQQLRESITVVKREAQRAIASSTSAIRTPNAFFPPPNIPNMSPYGLSPLVPGLSSVPGTATPISTPRMTPTASPIYSSATPTVPGRPPVPPIPPPIPILDPSPNSIQLQIKIKELEDEVKVLRLENEKSRIQISRFRERWDKLKESAKRKKSLKEGMSGATVSKIPEEDEGGSEGEHAGA
ncbi:hypothetical protein BOTBODRAFT_34683 [Botryobasidium botryosum FD-172 SS1]|uniref:MIT domain-containing protein n=1 Tax=Botryobasidium botryosum (strain FD-172 SS1) TaxID=930990 RepID=A0A067M9F7_BOTB1|nr:hypothetical protein BOTBODRAFT_34683 [Botryobasidium botryosum FD-172 SS1]